MAIFHRYVTNYQRVNIMFIAIKLTEQLQPQVYKGLPSQ